MHSCRREINTDLKGAYSQYSICFLNLGHKLLYVSKILSHIHHHCPTYTACYEIYCGAWAVTCEPAGSVTFIVLKNLHWQQVWLMIVKRTESRWGKTSREVKGLVNNIFKEKIWWELRFLHCEQLLAQGCCNNFDYRQNGKVSNSQLWDKVKARPG